MHDARHSPGFFCTLASGSGCLVPLSRTGAAPVGRGGSRGRGERHAVWRCGAEREGRCAARGHAARCVGRCSALRCPMQRAGIILAASRNLRLQVADGRTKPSDGHPKAAYGHPKTANGDFSRLREDSWHGAGRNYGGKRKLLPKCCGSDGAGFGRLGNKMNSGKKPYWLFPLLRY